MNHKEISICKKKSKLKTIVVPLITGLLLGVIPVAQTHVPPAISTWTGMWLLGNHFGYILGSLFIAKINDSSFKKSFLTSIFAITVANATYYLLIEALALLDFAFISQGKSVFQILISFTLWSITALGVTLILSMTLHFFKNSRNKLIKIINCISIYLLLLYGIWLDQIRFMIRFRFHESEDIIYRYINEHFMGRIFAGDVFWSIMGFLISTSILVSLLRNIKKLV